MRGGSAGLPLKPPTDAQCGLGRVQVLIRVADESIEVSVASFCVYIQIVHHVVLGADTHIGREAVAIPEYDRPAVEISRDWGIQIDPCVTRAAEHIANHPQM